MQIKKRVLFFGVLTVCAMTGVTSANFQILGSSLYYEGDSGPDYYYSGALTANPILLNGGWGHVNWSGTAGQYVSYEASGGDYYSVTDWGDPWYQEYYEEMQYAYSDMAMTFSITEAIQLVGFGDLGFTLTDINGTSSSAALNSIENGMTLSAGVYTIRVTDFGFGVTDSWSSNYYEETPEGPFYDYSNGNSYNYYGGFEFAAVPAPGIISLFAIAGIRRRRRM